MITVSNLSLTFGGQNLFKNVDLKFVSGNCYGVIGANGAGKSTFLRILSGELEPTTGEVAIDPRTRMSVLKQDHYAFDEFSVLDTIIQGNARLYEIMQQKDALYAKEDFTEEDGALAADLEAEFAEIGGWEAETEAAQLLEGLSIGGEHLYDMMSTLPTREKVKILLARALFGHTHCNVSLYTVMICCLSASPATKALALPQATAKASFCLSVLSHIAQSPATVLSPLPMVLTTSPAGAGQ